MIDQLAIQALQNSVGIDQASNVMGVAMTTNNGIVALPSDFKQHDLEQYMGTRRRMRGLFKTSVIADFATYVKTNKEEGACVFVSADQLSDMSAWAILNMGTTANPGHTDNRAKLGPAGIELVDVAVLPLAQLGFADRGDSATAQPRHQGAAACAAGRRVRAASGTRPLPSDRTRSTPSPRRGCRPCRSRSR